MSVSWGTQYSKLKTNLRLSSNRLKLLQKKKTEQAVKARCEIADFLSTDKEDRARIRVETIIREDFVVEAYELLEMYCELLLARFGIIQQMKELDDGIAEAVSSLLWVAPRIGHEIAEFKVVNDELTHKYGKQFAEAARMNQLPEPSRVSPKLVQKLSVSAPSKLLVEKYLITIAQSAGVDFVPDAKVMREDDDEIARAERNLINFMNEEQYGWSVRSDDDQNGGGGKGGGGSGGHFALGGSDPSMAHRDSFTLPTDDSAASVGIAAKPNSSAPLSAFVPQPLPRATSSPPPEYAPSPPFPPHGGVYQQPVGGHQQQQYGDNKSHIGGAVYPSVQPPAVASTPYPNAAVHHQHLGNFGHTQAEQHIYELPQERDDDFLLPKLPDPPSHMPATNPFAAHGGVAPWTEHANKAPSNQQQHNNGAFAGKSNKNIDNDDNNQQQDLDFDALAKRFEELKKRL